MNYIFLDLEWNSAYSVRQQRFINEIVQIGAVKLDDNLNFIDSFCVINFRIIIFPFMCFLSFFYKIL